MTNRFVVIPTRAWNRALELLLYVARDSGYTPIVLADECDGSLPPFVHGLQRKSATFGGWINEGLEYALKLDDDPRCIVLNDDMSLTPHALDAMFEALDEYDLVGLSGWEQTTTPSPLRGHLFGLRAKTMRMPEVPGLALWWWNTDDLYHQAVLDGKKISFVAVPYSHVSENERHDGSWRYPTEFLHSVQADHDYFWSRWHHLDPEHAGCYLRWWPDAVPSGQTHRMEWP